MALRWGFVTAGKICSDFAACVRSLPEAHKIVAVAARDINKAEAFADTHNIPKAYQGYEQLAKDPNVDIAYIGSVHTYHHKHAKLMLEHGKHVLCEKPLCTTQAEAKDLIALAKDRNLFLMEAIWSRFFPAYQKIREILASGQLGQVKMVTANFGFIGLDVERNISKETAGGALLDIGIYTLQFASMVHGAQQPSSISTSGYLMDSGVDEISSTVLKYPNNSIAVLNSSFNCALPNEAYIVGTKQRLKVCEPFWNSSRIEITEAGKVIEVHKYPLPDIKWNFNYINGQGMQYEVAAVGEYIKKGVTESPLITHKESILLAGIMDKARHDLGYYFDYE